MHICRADKTIRVKVRVRDLKHNSSSLCSLSLYIIYDCITIVGYSKPYYTPSSHNCHLSITATFSCPKGGRWLRTVART